MSDTSCIRGIRGAITIEEDVPELLEQATVELFGTILKLNDVKISDISHVIFTLTSDLKCAFPAKFVRTNFEADFLPMMCMNELEVENSLKKCLRMLVVVNTDKAQNDVKHVYLRGAKALRPDISL